MVVADSTDFNVNTHFSPAVNIFQPSNNFAKIINIAPASVSFKKGRTLNKINRNKKLPEKGFRELPSSARVNYPGKTAQVFRPRRIIRQRV